MSADERPPIGARVSVTEESLGVRDWLGTVVRHHADDELAFIVELDVEPPHLGWVSELGPRGICLSVGDCEVLP